MAAGHRTEQDDAADVAPLLNPDVADGVDLKHIDVMRRNGPMQHNSFASFSIELLAYKQLNHDTLCRALDMYEATRPHGYLDRVLMRALLREWTAMIKRQEAHHMPLG